MATIAHSPASLLDLVNPTERQLEFLDALADFDYLLYGGEAGGGKSYILRWALVLFLNDLYEHLGLANVTVGMFCEDYPTLLDRQISKMRMEFPPWLGTLRESGLREFRLHDEYGGGIIALRNLDDPSKYYSAEFAAVAVDELTRNPVSVFNDLRFRLRWPGVERPKFIAGTNPGGPGHAWVKSYWIDRKYPDEFHGIDELTGKPFDIRKQFKLVRARASDNPHLTPAYRRGLLSLPPDMAKRLARGDWNVYQGQYFPQFDAERHVKPRAEVEKRLRPWHQRWLCGDWGFHHPHAIYELVKDENSHIYVLGELWDMRVGEKELGARINSKYRGEKLQAFPFSWDAFGKISPRSVGKIRRSISELIAAELDEGIPAPNPADSSPGSRISGWRLLAQLLDADLVTIADDCPHLIECLPSLIRDEDNQEDVLKVDYEHNKIGDDPADALRMGVQNMLDRVPELPVAEAASARVAQYAKEQGKEMEELDINTTAQLHRRAANQIRRQRARRRGGLGRIWRPKTGQ